MASTHFLLLCFSVFFLCAIAYAQQSFFPPSIPLAVRSPYFSIWYNSAVGTQPLSESWPLFWRGATIGWSGKIRVDGITYSWMGDDNIWNSTANVTDIQITPTRSIFVMQAGPMNVTVTYLSPIEPSDWVNQSIPFSYVAVEAQAVDGATHDVQLYSDITSEFVTGIRPDSNLLGGDPVTWQTSQTSQTRYHETQPALFQQYSEYTQQAEDGKAYYAMALSSNLSWEIDTDVNCRQQFVSSGRMTNVQSSTTSGPLGSPWYVFALAVDLGTIQATSSPVTWAIGYVRDPVVQYKSSTGATDFRRPYWTTRYSDIGALIDAFVTDYPAAHARAVALDQKLMGDAANISPQYVDLVSLVARQVMGAVEITVPGGSGSGLASATDVKAFMKDIGYSQRISPVERMFAAFPAYLYFNASLGGALLEPLLEYQDNQSGQLSAARDLGPQFPNATGPSLGGQQDIEQSGNMLIMMYAHARVSGDGSLLSRHYSTAKRWADYLVNNTLMPFNQNSADGLTNPNMTNLAIKGIIGVKAMAEISRVMQRDSDTQQYDNQANALVNSWLSLAQSSDHQHLLGRYGDDSSSALLYNIYADVLLGTNLVPKDILSKQTQYYNNLLQTAASPLGLYFDNAAPANTASIAWTLFTAATVTDDGVRNQLIQHAWNRASYNKSGTIPDALPDSYNDITGDRVNNGGGAGAALGAIFSQLALTVPNTTIVVGDSPLGDPGSENGGGSGRSSKSHVGAIVGGVVGGVVLLVVLAGAAFYFWRRRRHWHTKKYRYKEDILEHPQPYLYDPSVQQDQHVPTATTPTDMDGTAAAVHTTSVSRAGTPPVQPAPVVLSPRASKARMRAEDMLASSSRSTPAGTPRSSTPTALGESLRSSQAGETLASVPTDFVGLRAEVEDLRRVVHGIREERLDPPPQYEN